MICVYLDIVYFSQKQNINSADIYLFKVNDENTGTLCEICSKLTIKIPERHQVFSLLISNI